MKHISRYYGLIAQSLHDAGIFVSADTLCSLRNMVTILCARLKQTRLLSRLPYGNWVDLREHTSMDTIHYQLKSMNRQYSLYSKNKVAFKNNLIALLDQTYPGVNAPPDDPVFQFLNKKRAEGKPYYVYMTAGCNKFLRIYYGRVREYLNTMNEPVDLDSTGLSH